MNKSRAQGRRISPTTGVEIEYCYRKCKGHYSRTAPIENAVADALPARLGESTDVLGRR